MGPARLALLAAALLSAASARAEEAGGCQAKWSLAREVAAFARPGLGRVEADRPLPGIMEPAVVALRPKADVGFAMPPGRKPAEGSFAAVVAMPPVAAAGLYQVTLSDAAWIDVIQGGRNLRSEGFTEAKGCPGLRKSVRFRLAPGEAATLQLSGAPADSIKVEVLPVE